jgi:hypothetical protein
MDLTAGRVAMNMAISQRFTRRFRPASFTLSPVRGSFSPRCLLLIMIGAPCQPPQRGRSAAGYADRISVSPNARHLWQPGRHSEKQGPNILDKPGFRIEERCARQTPCRSGQSGCFTFEDIDCASAAAHVVHCAWRRRRRRQHRGRPRAAHLPCGSSDEFLAGLCTQSA